MDLEAALKALEEARKEKEELEKRYAGISDPEFARTALKARNREALEKVLENNGLESLVARVEADAAAPHKKALETAEAELAKYREKERTSQFRADFAAAAKGKIADRYANHLAKAAQLEMTGESGKFSVGGASLDEYIKHLVVADPWLAGDTDGQQAPGSKAPVSGDLSNPWSKENWNENRQVQLYREDKTAAKSLMKAANYSFSKLSHGGE